MSTASREHEGRPFFDGWLFARRLSGMLLVAALAMGSYPLVTMALAEREAGAVEREYAQVTAGQPAAPRTATMAELAAAYRKQIMAGQPIGRLRIERIGLDAIVVEGSAGMSTDGRDDTLEKGPARLASTALPGEGGNTLLAGHRTTFTRPFWALDELEEGDRIVLELPYATFRYEVMSSHVVAPADIEVARDHGFEELTLSTCTPRFSALQRLVVHARLQSAQRRRGKEAA